MVSLLFVITLDFSLGFNFIISKMEETTFFSGILRDLSKKMYTKPLVLCLTQRKYQYMSVFPNFYLYISKL